MVGLYKPEKDLIFKKLRINLSWLDGRAAQREAKKKKEGEDEKSDGEAGHKEKDDDEEEKVIFVHYEQRKVMLSQLHPIENGASDPATAAPSELRQVQDRGYRKK